MEHIKEHFEQEAQEFDSLILKVIPGYREMIEAMVQPLPFNVNTPVKIIDPGAGTGTISEAVLKRFPLAEITCVDFQKPM